MDQTLYINSCEFQFVDELSLASNTLLDPYYATTTSTMEQFDIHHHGDQAYELQHFDHGGFVDPQCLQLDFSQVTGNICLPESTSTDSEVTGIGPLGGAQNPQADEYVACHEIDAENQCCLVSIDGLIDFSLFDEDGPEISPALITASGQVFPNLLKTTSDRNDFDDSTSELSSCPTPDWSDCGFHTLSQDSSIADSEESLSHDHPLLRQLNNCGFSTVPKDAIQNREVTNLTENGTYDHPVRADSKLGSRQSDDETAMKNIDIVDPTQDNNEESYSAMENIDIIDLTQDNDEEDDITMENTDVIDPTQDDNERDYFAIGNIDIIDLTQDDDEEDDVSMEDIYFIDLTHDDNEEDVGKFRQGSQIRLRGYPSAPYKRGALRGIPISFLLN
ncbi:hypothetical protein QQS21_010390 [Conoideocrella luteorostrata]|uniref:Uncharacterized protein n=1 Tax=Conoideocrella luteorostrata TaxID=1105319 RepID=A0AAJ0CF90_9HYPO|nr:hypothetical protein QQS21_010390 [Conoideocrella luteorostrata]